MLNYTTYLIEASLHKIDALLRLHPSAGVQPGYIHVNTFLGPRADNKLVQLAMATLDGVNAKRIALPAPRQIPVEKLVATQHALYADDVKDIVSKQAFNLPIQVLAHGGTYLIVNGHHRAAAAVVSQRSSILAHVIEE
jgi:hypothetical protein